MKRVLAICLLFWVQLSATDISQPEIQRFFYDYVNALKAGDDLSALNHWSLLDRTWADELGIRYKDMPIKLEAGSTLLRNLSLLKSGAATIAIDTITMSRGFARINYRITTKDTSFIDSYFAVTTATVEPSLTSSLRVFTESWDQVQGKYFDLIYRDLKLYERSNVDAADQFVEATAKTLGISPEKMAFLEKIKFRMVLCESFGEVQQMTGMPVHGDFYRSLDAVISKFSPPYHEIAQFLVAYANDSLPIYTLPFIEEGTATFLGGRWGRTAPVMLYLGGYIYRSGNCEWADLLTADSFRSWEDNPDFTYPVAGLFCKFLFESIGREKYFQLYRQLSGTEAEVRAITDKKFQDVVAAITGKTWVALQADFKAYAGKQLSAGILAGAPDQGKLVYESGTTEFQIRIMEDSAYYNVEITPKAGDVKAAVLIGEGQAQSSYQSFLFKEYFPDNEWRLQRHALIFSAAEVGTYDFYANAITGKYSVGFGANEPILKPGTNQYRFRVEKQLLGELDKQSIKLFPLK
jgi:hypothetical protein